MPTADREDTHCPLLSLPPELRLRIYDYLYTTQNRVILQVENQIQSYQFKSNDATPGSANLLKTCRQLYHEVLPVVYSRTTFKLTVFGTDKPPGGYGYEQFLWSRDSRWVLRHVRKLELVLHITAPADVDPALQRVVAIARQLPPTRKLESCTVACHLFNEFAPFGPPVLIFRGISKRLFHEVLRLERRAGLSVAEKDVSFHLWKEVVRWMMKYAPEDLATPTPREVTGPDESWRLDKWID